MRTVMIEFTRPAPWFKPLSWAIRLFEGTGYSHVRLRWVSSWGADMIYEASGSTVKFIGSVAQNDLDVTVLHQYAIRLTDEQYTGLLKLCIRNAGVNYGLLQILGIGLVKVFRLGRNPFSEGRKSQVCSEVVGRFLQEILGIGKHLDLDVSGPKDIKHVLDTEYNIIPITRGK